MTLIVGHLQHAGASDLRQQDGCPETEAIFQYLAILTHHGVRSTEAEEFKKTHEKTDPEFRKLAKGAEHLIEKKDQILHALEDLKETNHK